MGEDDGERETGDDEYGGDEASEIYGPPAAFIRPAEFILSAVREERVREGCKDECQCWSMSISVEGLHEMHTTHQREGGASSPTAHRRG